MSRLTPEEAWAKMSVGYTYVDVRSDVEFELGRPAGAVNVPISRMTPTGLAPDDGFVAAMCARFAKDARIILGCKSGNRSARAARLLEAEGFTDVHEQAAGWEGSRGPFGEVTSPGWKHSGLPVELE
jgi:rhodanese-related sulfurtransferase